LSSDAARYYEITVPGSGRIVATRLPGRHEDQVLVRTRYSGISRGTETIVFRGEVPESQHAVMRAPFQEGDFPGPVKYGYSSVGDVVEGPPELEGRTVFCLYPHQDRYVVPASATTLVPDGVPPERAVLAANMETAVNGVWDARPGPGDRIVVLGAGVVGALVAWLCRQLPGTHVTLVDPDPTRAAVARHLALDFSAEPPVEANADLVVHASGNPTGLVDALALAGPEALVLELSWYGARPVTLPLGEAFHQRRLTIRSSQVGRLPPERVPRWGYGRRMALALELLAAPELDALLTGESSFEELPDVMDELARDGSGTLCHRIRYD
jgi:threonine dehydrogenase-like Zn-dependent dehydrogenase